jgi:hypothetical protein
MRGRSKEEPVVFVRGTPPVPARFTLNVSALPTEVVFEFADPTAQGRLLYVQLVGSAPEGADLRHAHEGAEVAKIDVGA